MKYKHLTDSELELTTIEAVRTETLATENVLELLNENESRKLYLKSGYGSLREYCVKFLKYSDSSAGRRISAMYLMKEMPEIKEILGSGTVNLSTLLQANQFMYQKEKLSGEKLDLTERMEILNLIENKSQKEVEVELIKLSPEAALPSKDRERHITEELIEYKFTGSKTIKEKLEKLRNLLAHKNSNPTQAELIEMIADIALKQVDPLAKRARNSTQQVTAAVKQSVKVGEGLRRENKSLVVQINSSESNGCENKRVPSAELTRQVYVRDKDGCQFLNPITKLKCQSTHATQLDHIIPWSLGGKTTFENLRVLCRAHNLYLAEKRFGRKWERRQALQ